MDADWIAPDWPTPPSVRAVCTTRKGGVSLPPYDSLNLGDHVGDDPVAVVRNRALLREAIGVRPVYLQQVHASNAVRLEAGTRDGTQADACVATDPGLACTIMVADCLPVLFADRAGRAVAAAHAGWRGLAGGVLEATLHSLWNAMGVPPAEAADRTIAWLGPCIGPQVFEVGDEVRQAFVERQAQAAALFRPKSDGKWLADLQGLARLRLAASGVTAVHGNDGSAGWCSAGNPSRFFSHRRDRVSGRFAACVWLA
ncbi:peptidoglycan editing factor PgeF [Caenimonas terrae]|uniref:Purine nucleoside phosphorylase n=1 Tax=Caenimonas terrae TaxID=696074 RepID=A0ABW0NI77_9BURK